MKLYLVRHGQTAWNAESRAQGRIDVPLNETGIAQAEALASQLQHQHFDVIFSSPLSRARQTAEIIAAGRQEVITDDLLLERAFGDIEGQVIPSWTELDADHLDFAPGKNVHGMESFREVAARAEQFLNKLKQTYSADAEILIVAHGALLKMMHWAIVGYDEQTDLMSWRLKNCELSLHEI